MISKEISALPASFSCSVNCLHDYFFSTRRNKASSSVVLLPFNRLMGPDSERTHYEILGLDRFATKDEIREAFWSMARLLHPDSHYYSDIINSAPTHEQVELFKRVTLAYHTLIDDDKRKAYDSSLKKQTTLYDNDDADAEIAAKLAELGLGEDIAKIAGVRIPPPKTEPSRKPQAVTQSSRPTGRKASPQSTMQQKEPAKNSEWWTPRGTAKKAADATKSERTLQNPEGAHKRFRSW